MKNKKILVTALVLVFLFSVWYWNRGHIPLSPIKTLQVEDIKIGKGEVAMVGKKVKIHYSAYIYQGKMFDSTYGKQPLTFRLGNGETIAGFEQGIPGMKVGGIRKMTMPPDMGFGATGTSEKIPINSALTYEVELLDSKSR